MTTNSPISLIQSVILSKWYYFENNLDNQLYNLQNLKTTFLNIICIMYTTDFDLKINN